MSLKSTLFILLSITLFHSPALLAKPKIAKNCIFKGKKLYGKIKIVKNWPDFKVKIVTSFPDLKVKMVKNWPSECGQWQVVENWPDLKIQFVDSFPDFTIKRVENWPGLP